MLTVDRKNMEPQVNRKLTGTPSSSLAVATTTATTAAATTTAAAATRAFVRWRRRRWWRWGQFVVGLHCRRHFAAAGHPRFQNAHHSQRSSLHRQLVSQLKRSKWKRKRRRKRKRDGRGRGGGRGRRRV